MLMRRARWKLAAAITGSILCAHVSAAARDRFATADGARVHYQIDGDGPRAVVFVHGWACDATFWSEQVPFVVAHGWRAVAVDLPGHGESEQPDVSYTSERLARGVEAVLRQERITAAVLVGHSMGGLVVRYVADDVPGILGLVIADSRSVLLGEGDRDKARRTAFGESLRRDASDKTLRDYLPTFFVDATPPAVRESVSARMLHTNRRVAVSAYEGTTNTTRRWSESPTSIPTLAIYGQFAEPDTETILRRQFTRLEYVRWSEPVGHFLMLERPQAFNAALLAFLDAR